MASIVFMACVNVAIGQSAHGNKLCQFYNIDKTVKAKLGEGEEAIIQRNSIKALWPVLLNGKECPRLQEKFCLWMTGKEDIKQLDRAIEEMLYTDNESVPFGEGVKYRLLDGFDEEALPISSYACTIELQSMGNRFALFHLLSNMYFAGAAHGMYSHNYITYDTELDKIVTLEDVLLDPELIRPLILESIVTEYDYTEENLFLPEDNLPPVPSVFFFENGLLHLVYQAYEIASFAQGTIDVPIYYTDDDNAPEFFTPYGKEVMKESLGDDLY